MHLNLCLGLPDFIPTRLYYPLILILINMATLLHCVRFLGKAQVIEELIVLATKYLAEFYILPLH